ncbi:hypothetical protein FACS189413_16390 [Bacteroidia bacterium]|nr:hypothetical protein FACS189413_16390 [Bacteroidia bacterium]
MIVKCKQTNAKYFDLQYVTTVFSNQFDYGGRFGIELDREYIVMGIVTYNDSNCAYYLIDTYGRPDWYPNLLFDIIDNSLPNSWNVCIYNCNSLKISSLYGFKELCNNDDFYDKLIERDEDAMRIYFKRKIELERELTEY